MKIMIAKLMLVLTGAWDQAGASVTSVDWTFAPFGVGMLCLGGGLAVVLPVLCYRRTAEGLPRRWRLMLGTARGLSLLLLALMASGAAMRIGSSQARLPRLLLLTDDSPSMQLQFDGVDRLSDVMQTLRASGTLAALESRFDLQLLTTSGRPVGTPDAAPQELPGAIVHAASSIVDAPLAQILIVSDGISIGHAALPQVAAELPAPCHAVGVREQTDWPDAGLGEVVVPAFVYEHDRALLQVRVRIDDAAGEAAVRLWQATAERRELASAAVHLTPNTTANCVLEFKAPAAGLQHLYIELEALPNELTLANNRLDFNLDVRPERLRVLIIEGEPSWEYRYALRALQADPVIACSGLVRLPGDEWFYQGKLAQPDGTPVLPELSRGMPVSSDELAPFDVVILGDLERKLFEDFNRFQLFEDFVGVRGGGLMTIGGHKVYAAGNFQETPLARMLPFVIEPAKTTQLINRFQVHVTTQGLLHPALQLEYDAARNRQAWGGLPWVEGGNAIGRVKPGAALLLVHPEAKTSAGPRPVAAAGHYGRGRVFSSALDGTWHWALAGDKQVDYHQRFWGLVMRWLAGDPRRRGAGGVLQLDDAVVEVGKTAGVALHLRDDVGNPRLDAQVAFTCELPDGNQFQALATNEPGEPGRYGLRFTPMQSGTMSVRAVIDSETDASHSAELSFFIGPSRAEFQRIKPDNAALQALCSATGGTYVPLAAAATLDLPAVSAEQQHTVQIRRLWQAPGLFLLLLAALIFEWYVRKHRGLA